MTIGVILIHDPSFSKPSNNIAHDAINSQIDGKVVVHVIGMSKVCPYAEYSEHCKQVYEVIFTTASLLATF